MSHSLSTLHNETESIFEIEEITTEAVVPYHIRREEGVFSLKYVSTDTSVEELREDHQSPDSTTHVIQFTNPEFTGVYSCSNTHEFGDSNLSNISTPSTRILVNHLNSILSGVLDTSKSSWNKKLELSKAATTFNELSWKESIPTTAASILSNLIRAHPLPNGNHRSSIAFTFLYLETAVDEFSTEDMLDNYPSVIDWLDAFIIESKRILTFRNNYAMFRILEDIGVQTIIRKNGVVIHFENYPSSVVSSADDLDSMHQNVTEDLLEDIIQTTDPYIAHEDDDGKRVFSDRLEQINTCHSYTLGTEVSTLRD